MWDIPGPGIEPWCPALAGGFLYHCAIREVPYSFLDHLVSGLVMIAFAWLWTVSFHPALEQRSSVSDYWGRGMGWGGA